MTVTRARLFVVSVFVILLSISIGYFIGVNGFIVKGGNFPKVTIDRVTPVEKNLDFSLFWKVWDTLNVQYFDKSKVVPSQMVYGAIKGMVASMGDPYSIFLTPSENKVSEQDLQGNFDGVGIQLGYRDSQLSVIAPLPQSPADKAGIKAGDYIVEIKDEKKNIDQSTAGMTLPQAVQIIRGDKGTRVTLTLVREGADKPMVVDLIRDSIDVPSVVLSYENGNVANLKLLKFGADTKTEWDKKVNEIIRKDGVDKIVLDLRNNPGGYLQSAVDIAGDFLPINSVVVMEEEAGGKRTEFRTTTYPRLLKYKLVVLVNKGSASASEILSGALRDQRKVELVGDTTFGKGTVQEPLQLDNGAGLHITVAKWLTPSGDWVHSKGLTPDVKVSDDESTTDDEQLKAALDVLR
jgi:carboxyl-terminal processing protease